MSSPDVDIDYKHNRKRQPDPLDQVKEAVERADRTISAIVYKIDPPRIYKALEKAAKEDKVDVRILVNDGLKKRYRQKLLTHGDSILEESEQPRWFRKMHSPSKELATLALTKRVEIRQWTPAKLHVKLLIIDDKEVLSGSYNWTDSAAAQNAELLLRFTNRDHVKKFVKVFKGLYEREEWAKPLIR